jgi:hypothetical protein
MASECWLGATQDKQTHRRGASPYQGAWGQCSSTAAQLPMAPAREAVKNCPWRR